MYRNPTGPFLKEISAIVRATCRNLPADPHRVSIIRRGRGRGPRAEATLLRSQRLGLGRYVWHNSLVATTATNSTLQRRGLGSSGGVGAGAALPVRRDGANPVSDGPERRRTKGAIECYLGWAGRVSRGWLRYMSRRPQRPVCRVSVQRLAFSAFARHGFAKHGVWLLQRMVCLAS